MAETKERVAKPDFRVLSADDIDRIHTATLEVLERTGVDVLDQEALGMLRDAGARVTDGSRVRIPAGLVEKAIETAPSSVTLHRRDGEPTVVLEGKRIYFGTGSDCPYLIDPFSGEKRLFTKEDVGRAALLCDGLTNIDFFMSVGLVSDVSAPVSDLHQFEAMLVNTEKPIVFTAHTRQGMADIIEMASMAVGGAEKLRRAPCIGLYAEPITPLRHYGPAVQKLLLAAEKEIPVIYTPCTMAGATSPVTLAGTLVTGNAEVLSGLVISQLKRPGAPFIGGGVISIMDMRAAILSYGCPELSLMSAAQADLCHHYQLPIFGTCGCSDAKVLDEQAAIESTMSCLMGALSGANLIHDIGFLEYALTGSFDMIVMTDEIIGMVKQIVSGIRLDDEALAVELIDKVGPGGHFVGEAHTARHFRQEHWIPRLMDRSNYESWQEAGGKTMRERVNERTKQILNEHRTRPLSEDCRGEISRLVASREREANKG